jgi:ABC-type dipeptide/oligopeptide/nickel transport system ATPase subunit
MSLRELQEQTLTTSPQVPQRPSLLPGTPQDFLTTILSYSSRHPSKDGTEGKQPIWERALAISREWGMDGAMWRREWATLSGGEAQRMGLAVAVSLGMAEVLLLDGEFLFTGFANWGNAG